MWCPREAPLELAPKCGKLGDVINRVAFRDVQIVPPTVKKQSLVNRDVLMLGDDENGRSNILCLEPIYPW